MLEAESVPKSIRSFILSALLTLSCACARGAETHHPENTVSRQSRVEQRFNVIADTQVVSAAQRKNIGAKASPPVTDKDNGFAWPDTPLGTVMYGKDRIFFASDGAKHNNTSHKYGSATATFGNLSNPLGNAGPVNTVIHPNLFVNPLYKSYSYVGGGPVFKVPDNLPGAGKLLMVYHAERTTTGAVGFYSLLGLAKSADAGKTWIDLGVIVAANQRYEKNLDGYEIGDPHLVPDAGRTIFPHSFSRLDC